MTTMEQMELIIMDLAKMKDAHYYDSDRTEYNRINAVYQQACKLAAELEG